MRIAIVLVLLLVSCGDESDPCEVGCKGSKDPAGCVTACENTPQPVNK